MEVLLWLVPAGVVTGLAMLWAGWQGRRGAGELDRDEAVRRLGEALDRPAPRHDTARAAPRAVRRPADRSTSVAVRRTPPPPPSEPARPEPQPRRAPRPRPVEPAALREPGDEQRRSA